MRSVFVMAILDLTLLFCVSSTNSSIKSLEQLEAEVKAVEEKLKVKSYWFNWTSKNLLNFAGICKQCQIRLWYNQKRNELLFKVFWYNTAREWSKVEKWTGVFGHCRIKKQTRHFACKRFNCDSPKSVKVKFKSWDPTSTPR